MKPLHTTFTKYGHLFTQIARKGQAALFERTSNGKHICYELIKVQQGGERTIQGRVIPAAEYYPGDNAFGTQAWSLIYHSPEKAMNRFFQLCQSLDLPRSTPPECNDTKQEVLNETSPKTATP